MTSKKLLLINPNTTALMTEKLRAHTQAIVGSQLQIYTRTAAFGAPYISDEASYAIAGHATLDAWQESIKVPSTTLFDSALIGCFGDPGLFALREVCPCKVTGLAEASFIQAAKVGRFAIVTGGARWVPMLERLAMALHFSSQLAGIETVTQTGAELAADPETAKKLLTLACQRAVSQFNADVVILGGAGLAGVAAQISDYVAVPVIDSVTAGVQIALSLTHSS
jgi:allantoin racemase